VWLCVFCGKAKADQSAVGLVVLMYRSVLFDKKSSMAYPTDYFLWFGSYLSDRQQRVRANQCLSTWKPLMAGMPQGSWLGPLSFLVLINEISVGCSIVKYVDDSTLSGQVQLKYASVFGKLTYLDGK